MSTAKDNAVYALFELERMGAKMDVRAVMGNDGFATLTISTVEEKLMRVLRSSIGYQFHEHIGNGKTMVGFYAG